MPYQPGVPTGTVPLNQDYLNLQTNFTEINNQYNVDHVPLTSTSGTPPNGYHTVIHQASRTSVNTVAGVNQMFAGVSGTLQVNASATPAIPNGTDTQLYALSGAGILSQLTGSTRAATGLVWCSGILIQWGSFIGTAASQDVTYGKAFPNGVFAVFLQAKSSNGSVNGVTDISDKTKFKGIGVNTVGYYYLAIGY